MTATPTCLNCETTQNITSTGLCTLCYLAVAGASLAGMTEEQALASVRESRADKRMQPFNNTFEKVARDMLGNP